MLIGYKLLGNEVLLPMKFLSKNGFRLQADGTLIIEKLKHGSENKKTNLENDMFNESAGLLRCLDISGGIERASSRGKNFALYVINK